MWEATFSIIVQTLPSNGSSTGFTEVSRASLSKDGLLTLASEFGWESLLFHSYSISLALVSVSASMITTHMTTSISATEQNRSLLKFLLDTLDLKKHYLNRWRLKWTTMCTMHQEGVQPHPEACYPIFLQFESPKQHTVWKVESATGVQDVQATKWTFIFKIKKIICNFIWRPSYLQINPTY